MVEYFDESYFKDYSKSEVTVKIKRFVSAEDYQRLEAENAALRARCERFEGALKSIIKSYGVADVIEIAKQALEVPK